MDLVGEMAAPAAVLALLGIAWWSLRRHGRAAPARGGRLERLDRLALGPQHTLHLVRVGDRVLLLASSPGGCALLESLSLGDSGRKAEDRP
jgi:flagellar biosynthetic protein FliO